MQKTLLQDETLAEKIINKGFWLYLFAILLAPIGYIIKVILSNNLEIYEIGLIYSIISFFILIKIFNDFGINHGYSRFMPKYYIEEKYDDLKTIFYIGVIIQLLTTIIISILIYLSADYLSENYFKNQGAKSLLYIFIFYFIFQNGITQINSVFRAFQNTFAFKFTNFLKNFSLLIFIILFSIFGVTNFITYSYAWLIGSIISFIIGLIIFINYYSKIVNKGVIILNSKKVKAFFSFSIYALLGTNAIIIISNIDMQMIMYYIGAEQAGIYTNFLSLIGIITLLLSPLVGFITPLVSEYTNKKQYKKIEELQYFLYKYYITSSIIISAFLIGLGKYISIVLFGTKFIESGILLEKISVFGILNVIFIINLSLLMGLGKSKERFKVLISALMINIVLNLILIPIFGILGAGVATGISWLIISMGSYLMVKKEITIKNDYVFLIKNIIISMVLIIIIKFISYKIFIINDAFRYINLLYISIIFITYLIIFVIFNINDIKQINKNIRGIKKI